MNQIKIDSNEFKKLNFKLDVEGAEPSEINELRFTIESPKFKVSYPGVLKEGMATVQVGGLSDILKNGDYKFCLEVFMKNNYFPVMEGSVLLKSVKIKTEMLDVAKQGDDSPIRFESSLIVDKKPTTTTVKVKQKTPSKSIVENDDHVQLLENKIIKCSKTIDSIKKLMAANPTTFVNVNGTPTPTMEYLKHKLRTYKGKKATLTEKKNDYLLFFD